MKHIYCPGVDGFDSLSLGIEDAFKMKLKIVSEDTVYIEIEPGGHTPDHAHADKERVVVMCGKGEVITAKDRKIIEPGDFLEFDADDRHQIINTSDVLLGFMCFRNQR